MSKLKSSFAAKAVAVFLLAVMGIVFVGSLIGVGVMADAATQAVPTRCANVCCPA